MKILYVVTSADQGGAQRYVLMLAEHFHGTIVAGNEHTWLFNEAKKRGIRTIVAHHLKRAISPYHDLRAIKELRDIIQAEQPDIVHLNSTKAGILGSFALARFTYHLPPKTHNLPETNRLTSQPINSPSLIYTVHGFILNEPLNGLKRSFYGLLERRASKYRQATIAVSEEDARALREKQCVRPESLTVIENGIEAIDFLGRRSARQQLNLADNVFVIGTIANLYQTKGLDLLIEALGSAVAQHPNKHITLAIIGDGPERATLQKIIARHQIEKHVLFFGQINNASRLMKAFDLFVLPSRKEGMPFTILEAMQAELPIIATRVGGIPQALGEAGILVAPNHVGELTQSISTLIEHQSERARLGALAKKRSELFSQAEMIRKTGETYDAVNSSACGKEK